MFTMTYKIKIVCFTKLKSSRSKTHLAFEDKKKDLGAEFFLNISLDVKGLQDKNE